MKKALGLAWLITVICCSFTVPASAQEEIPASFTIDANGSLTCNGIAEDACAYYDEVPTPQGTFYLVQGSYSRQPDATDKRSGKTDFINVYFAVLCERIQNTLNPVFNFLEGRERASDLHLHDLDGDGTDEVIVTGIFDSRGSYAAVYRMETGKPVKIFTRRANTPNTDFEPRDGEPVLTFQQRGKTSDQSVGPLRQEVFVWNGKEFVER